TISATLAPAGVLGNYDITYNTALFTITARPITVTADDKSKFQGDPDPALTYQITAGSLVGSDTFSGALTRVAGEAVGTYPIQQGTLALSGNYIITFNGGTLTIRGRNQPPDTDPAVPSIGGCLWPPNHKFVDVNIVGVTDPDGDPVTIQITGVTSDEPTAGILGAGGAKEPDAIISLDSQSVQIRTERSGTSNGRVYIISFSASDGNGGVSDGTVQICVPHDQSDKCKDEGDCWCPEKKCCCIDDGQDFDATLPPT
ncbi:MAG: hypothetical protein LUO87_02485, partial [Methanomicrobiales archaeon]|nr:hypothetical protein [Methanomicrobiales archaeon]